MFEMTTRRLLALGVGVGSVLLLGACGGDDEQAGAEVATLVATEVDEGNAADSATGEEAGSSDLEPDEAALEFSQCMRDQGLDFPDLSVDAEGNIELRSAFQAVEPGTEGFREAMDACGEILEQTGFGGGPRQVRNSTEFQDALLEFSECLRDEGFDVGDLTLGGPGPGDGQPDGDGGEAAGAQDQQGQRSPGFGNRGARFAENLGLDYEDPAVAEAVDGCMVVIDQALADLGVDPAPDQG